jgi:flagellin
MATINSHGSFYRIQDNMSKVQRDLGSNMQRLSSGIKNITAGSRPTDVAIVNTMEAGIATTQYGKMNADSAVAALEMAVADLTRLSDIVTRLYEMNQIGSNVFTTTADKALLKLEYADLQEEFKLVGNNIQYRGKDIAKAVSEATTKVEVGSVVFGSIKQQVAFGLISDTLEVTDTNISNGTGSVNLAKDKLHVDTLRLQAATQYNMVSYFSNHAANHLAASKIEIGNYRDVDFASETSELAKNQILAQAGTAMLAQANAQGQGVLALLQT